jgi:serine/threonine protein kinase
MHTTANSPSEIMPYNLGAQLLVRFGLYANVALVELSPERCKFLVNHFPLRFEKGRSKRSVMASGNEMQNNKYFLKIQPLFSFWRGAFQRELAIMERLRRSRSSCVPRLVGAWICGEKAYTVMETVNGSTLRRYIRDRADCFKLSDIVKLVEQVQWMHSEGIVHGDLHMDNILVEMDDKKSIYRIVFIDFGQAEDRRGHGFSSYWMDYETLFAELFEYECQCVVIAQVKKMWMHAVQSA